MASNEENNVYRGRTAHLILYTDNESHMKALEKIKNDYLLFAYILHDKDTFDDDSDGHKKGDLKKPHYHVILRFKEHRHFNAVAKDLGIENRFIKSDSYIHALNYLTHIEYPNKYQYDVSLVEGTLKGIVESLYFKDITTEDERVNSIMKILYSYTSKVSLRQFVTDVCDSGYFSDLRRSYMMFKDLFYEYQSKLISEKLGYKDEV